MIRHRLIYILLCGLLAIAAFGGCSDSNDADRRSTPLTDESHISDGMPVAVLYKEGFRASGVPSGLTPQWIVESLLNQSIPAKLISPDEIGEGFRVIINPYGEAFPKEAAEGMAEAQSRGIPLVSLAGTPFSKPDGKDDREFTGLFGMFAAPSSGSFVTSSAITTFGSSALPSLADDGFILDYASGDPVHAQYPSKERVLSYYISIEHIDGVPTVIDGGPSIVMVRGEKPVVAVGYCGNSHPLNPQNPRAAGLLAELVNIFNSDYPFLSDVRAYREGGSLKIKAVSSGGIVTAAIIKNGEDIAYAENMVSISNGGLTTTEGEINPAPVRWTPVNLKGREKVSPLWLEIRLFYEGHMTDVKRLPANPAEISIRGTELLLNDEPVTIKGMTPSHGFAPDTTGSEKIRILKSDIDKMIDLGVNSIRNYGTWNDWYVDYTANKGLMIFDIIPQGWTWDFTDEMYESLKPWAVFMADRGRERHSIAGYVLANEILDTHRENVIPKLKGLNKIVKDIDPNHPTVYGAHPSNIITYGALEFTDMYGLDNYGFTWPIAIDTAGFTAYIKYCQAYLNKGRPMILLEYGTNGWPGAMLAMAEEVYLKTTATKEALERFQARKFMEKWNAMMNNGVVGGYAFIWADEPGHTLPFKWYDDFVNRYKFPDDSIYAPYHPLNEEEYWGFHDIYRNPRLIVDALDTAYHDRQWRP